MKIAKWLFRHQHGDTNKLADAFPRSLSDDAHAMLACLPPTALAPSTSFSVLLDGERLTIPYRIHNDEPSADATATLSSSQRTMLHCIYTRHHDGFTRQRHLEAVIESAFPWIVPFVVQLIGEYVIEILTTIYGRLDVTTPGGPDRLRYGRFIAENMDFFDRTASRIASYWNCYYRFDFPVQRPQNARFATYPGFLLIDALRSAALEVHTLASEEPTATTS